MSAFERKRLENIEANRTILSDISTTAKKVIPTRPKVKPVARRPRREPVSKPAPRPTRVSSRLAGLEADNETLKRKMEVESQVQAEQNRARKMRVTEDLRIGDIVADGRKYGNSVDGITGLFRGAQPGVRTFTEEDVKETTTNELKELRVRMGGLKLYEHWAPNGITLPSMRKYPKLFVTLIL